MYSQIAIFFIVYLFFFFNDTATTEIYTLSLHDALPIYAQFEQPFRIDKAAANARGPTDRIHRFPNEVNPSLESVAGIGIDRDGYRVADFYLSDLVLEYR